MGEKSYGLIGIDYGAKLAGTTVVAELRTDLPEAEISLLQSTPKQDADDMLQSYISSALLRHPQVLVFFDAPLSLPGVYTNSDTYSDYFYREADKALNAMSPMFLGGLTARAMRLKHQFEGQKVTFFETYPAVQARRLDLKSLNYKGEIAAVGAVWNELQRCQEWQNIKLENIIPKNWHQIDALLALLGAIRYTQNTHTCFGNPNEGLIYV